MLRKLQPLRDLFIGRFITRSEVQKFMQTSEQMYGEKVGRLETAVNGLVSSLTTETQELRDIGAQFRSEIEALRQSNNAASLDLTRLDALADKLEGASGRIGGLSDSLSTVGESTVTPGDGASGSEEDQPAQPIVLGEPLDGEVRPDPDMTAESPTEPDTLAQR